MWEHVCILPDNICLISDNIFRALYSLKNNKVKKQGSDQDKWQGTVELIGRPEKESQQQERMYT